MPDPLFVLIEHAITHGVPIVGTLAVVWAAAVCKRNSN